MLKTEGVQKGNQQKNTRQNLSKYSQPPFKVLNQKQKSKVNSSTLEDVKSNGVRSNKRYKAGQKEREIQNKRDRNKLGTH